MIFFNSSIFVFEYVERSQSQSSPSRSTWTNDSINDQLPLDHVDHHDQYNCHDHPHDHDDYQHVSDQQHNHDNHHDNHDNLMMILAHWITLSWWTMHIYIYI